MTESEKVFYHAFLELSLPSTAWTHEAHLRMAWLVLSIYHFDEALERIRSGINRYNDNVIKKEKAYHETITVAFTRLISAGRESLPVHHRFEDFKAANPLLFDRQLTALLKHYRNSTLFSAEARSRFVEPDLAPLPEFLFPVRKQNHDSSQKADKQRQEQCQR